MIDFKLYPYVDISDLDLTTPWDFFSRHPSTTDGCAMSLVGMINDRRTPNGYPDPGGHREIRILFDHNIGVDLYVPEFTELYYDLSVNPELKEGHVVLLQNVFRKEDEDGRQMLEYTEISSVEVIGYEDIDPSDISF